MRTVVDALRERNKADENRLPASDAMEKSLLRVCAGDA